MEDANGDCAITYDDSSRDRALAQIKDFQADFGGTEILEALLFAQTQLDRGLTKRIFLLTDGSVSSTDRVIQ